MGYRHFGRRVAHCRLARNGRRCSNLRRRRSFRRWRRTRRWRGTEGLPACQAGRLRSCPARRSSRFGPTRSSTRSSCSGKRRPRGCTPSGCGRCRPRIQPGFHRRRCRRPAVLSLPRRSSRRPWCTGRRRCGNPQPADRPSHRTGRTARRAGCSNPRKSRRPSRPCPRCRSSLPRAARRRCRAIALERSCRHHHNNPALACKRLRLECRTTRRSSIAPPRKAASNSLRSASKRCPRSCTPCLAPCTSRSRSPHRNTACRRCTLGRPTCTPPPSTNRRRTKASSNRATSGTGLPSSRS
jgi:hypothetical protein